MKTWIALFRGINVGGNNILPMAQLRAGLESLGLSQVRSYIQSGNVVFVAKSGSAKSVGAKISNWVEEHYDFRPQVLLLEAEQFRDAVQANPFPEGIAEPKTLHFSFLAEKPKKPNLEAIAAVQQDSERFELKGLVFYLHAPEGIGRSKLAASAERHLGVATTARNFRTVEKILALAEA